MLTLAHMGLPAECSMEGTTHRMSFGRKCAAWKSAENRATSAGVTSCEHGAKREMKREGGRATNGSYTTGIMMTTSYSGH
ncbi:hypothetical protein CesoFtcFv8_000585 [Champsocephalus esox]|uniref:Uncharacterized protein n=1 Tax=Champsocephalus esox TaxID=159716 RepID=A0AAN8HGL5_9TELE|nr:hypothetical protein CesoFtcFv8_000585 [Champsocephalus esox]